MAERTGCCRICGDEFTTKWGKQIYCGKACYRRVQNERQRVKHDPRPCVVCGAIYTPLSFGPRSYQACSRRCIIRYKNRVRAGLDVADPPPRQCRWCQKTFIPLRRDAFHCSRSCNNKRAQHDWYIANRAVKDEQNKAWQQRNPQGRSGVKGRRRARQVQSATAPFTTADLAQRWAYYGGRCWVCRAVATATDHVKPLSKGGAHMLCNLRPICKPCNSQKAGTWPFDVEAFRARSA